MLQLPRPRGVHNFLKSMRDANRPLNTGGKEVCFFPTDGQAVFVFLTKADFDLLVEEIRDAVGRVRHGLAQQLKQHRQSRQALLAINHR